MDVVYVVINNPPMGAYLVACDTTITGNVNHRRNPFDTVSINLDNSVSSAPIQADNTFSKFTSLVSGSHTLTVTYYSSVGQASATTFFSSSCGTPLTLSFTGPTADNDRKVLIHNYGSLPYTSSYQQDLNGGSGLPGEIRIEFKATLGGQPASTDVYFRVTDPADGSPYNTGALDDNKGGDKTTTPKSPAILGGIGVSSAGTGVWKVKSGTDDGVAQVILQLPGSGSNPVTSTNLPAMGGDNYVIEASLDPNFATGSIVTSSTIRAWKRAYIEHVKMWRTGQFVTQTSGAGTSDPRKIYVADNSIFHAGDKIHIASANSTAGEHPTIASVDENNILTTVEVLNGRYPATVVPNICDPAHGTDKSLDPKAFTPYCAVHPWSFVALESDGAYDVAPNETTLGKAFDDAYLEWKILPDPEFIPSWPFILRPTLPKAGEFIAERTVSYFKNAEKDNHVQLVSAGRVTALDTSPLYAISATLGTAKNFSWILYENLKTDFPASQNARDSTTAHELAHHWTVNLPPNPACQSQDPTEQQAWCGHDYQRAWAPTGTDPACLMDQIHRDRTVGVQRFHTTSAAPTKDLYCIRGHVDSIFSDTCTW